MIRAGLKVKRDLGQFVLGNASEYYNNLKHEVQNVIQMREARGKGSAGTYLRKGQYPALYMIFTIVHIEYLSNKISCRDTPA